MYKSCMKFYELITESLSDNNGSDTLTEKEEDDYVEIK